MYNKKGAMFGLESRAFKKQFGELFLARMHSVTPKEAHGARIQTKRGAMFGLDARIALAIFGALSVISGAALYSAIQQSKVSALTAEFDNAQKAYDAYFLDTGLEMPIASHTGFFQASHLINDPSVAGWKGPYLPYEVDSGNSYYLKHPNYNYLIYINSKDTEWTTGAENWTLSGCSTGGADCYIWSMIIGPKDLAVVKELDKIYDGSIDPINGNFRWYEVSGEYRLVLKYRKYK